MLISTFMAEYSEKDIPVPVRGRSCSKYTTCHIRSNVTRLLHLHEEESMKKVIRARFSMSYCFRVDSLVEVSIENLLYEC